VALYYIYRLDFRPKDSFSSWNISSTFRIGTLELEGRLGILLNDVFCEDWEGTDKDTDEKEGDEDTEASL